MHLDWKQFRVPIAEIRAEIEKRGLDVKWTMAAAALEYKETLAIEKSMANDKDAKERWLQNQETVTDIVSDEDDSNDE